MATTEEIINGFKKAVEVGLIVSKKTIKDKEGSWTSD